MITREKSEKYGELDVNILKNMGLSVLCQAGIISNVLRELRPFTNVYQGYKLGAIKTNPEFKYIIDELE